MTLESSPTAKTSPESSSSVVRERVCLETKTGNIEVERQLLFRHGAPCEMVYLIDQSNPEHTFHWDIHSDGTAENDHRSVPNHLRGQGLGKAIMQDAEAFMKQEFGVSELWFKSMKTDSLSFALSQGYEITSDVEAELFEQALAKHKQWLHDRLRDRLFYRVFGLGPSLKKTI